MKIEINKWTIAGIATTVGTFVLNVVANKKAKHDIQETVATEVTKQINKIMANND